MTLRLLSLSALLFLSASLLVSCEKEQNNELGEAVSEEAFRDMEDAGRLGAGGCYSIIFPVTLVFEDGTEVEVQNRMGIQRAIRAWAIENGRPTTRPEIAYPFDVEVRNGRVLTINNDEEFTALIRLCRPLPNHPNPCYNLIFPITMELPNGTTVELEGPVELRVFLRRWIANNPNSDLRPQMVFPIEVMLTADESIVTVESREELMALRRDCLAGNFGPCFTLVYPLGIVIGDNEVAIADSPEAARDIYRAWLADNPGATERPPFDYPIEVTLTEDGSVVTVNSQEELRALWQDCH